MIKTYRLLLALIVVSSAPYISAHRQEEHGRSFLQPRQLFDNLALTESGWHSIIQMRQKGHSTAFQAIGAYQHSIRMNKTNRYFAPCRTNNILITGDDAPNACARTVRAEWLMSEPNTATFASNFVIKPRHEQIGALIEYNKTLASFIKSSFFEDIWVDVSAPIQHTTVHLDLVETTQTLDGVAHPVRAAFNNPHWCAGKADCKREKTNLAEIRLRWGQSFVSQRTMQFMYYTGVSIPTGSTSDPKFWFDAINGFNGHYAINGGMQMQFLLNRDPSTLDFCCYFNVDDLFLIRRHQMRTYDLYNKPWSRFMLYSKESCPATNVPGVNIFTLDSVVRPYNIADFSMGWRLITSNCECELGYDVWGHGDEIIKVRYPHSFCADWGITGTGGGTASGSTIAQQADNDATFVTIPVSELNPYSAATGSALTQKAHGAVTIRYNGHKAIVLFTTGAFIEFAQKNSSFSEWGWWFKLAGSF